MKLFRAIPVWGAYAVATALLFGCSCDHITKSEERSPSGSKIATVTETLCGPPGDDSTQLNIRAANRPFSLERGVVVAVDGRHLITVHWDTEAKLIVYLPKSALPKDFVDPPIPTQHNEVDGVQIEYQPL